MDDDLRLRMREVRCRFCDASPGEPCRTPAGKALLVPHTKRINAWYLRNDHLFSK